MYFRDGDTINMIYFISPTILTRIWCHIMKSTWYVFFIKGNKI